MLVVVAVVVMTREALVIKSPDPKARQPPKNRHSAMQGQPWSAGGASNHEPYRAPGSGRVGAVIGHSVRSGRWRPLQAKLVSPTAQWAQWERGLTGRCGALCWCPPRVLRLLAATLVASLMKGSRPCLPLRTSKPPGLVQS